MKKFFILLLISSLYATVNEPLRFELFSGYRNDRIHWHLQEPGEGGAFTYSELYRDVEFWENGVVLKVIHRDLVFFVRGAYGTFGTGTVFQRYPARETRFTFDTDGWSADGTGYFGYAVNLTADRTYRVLLIPLIGYAAYFEQLKRKGTDSEGSFTTTLPGSFRLNWNGVILGGAVTVETTAPITLNAGYTYQFMHNRTHSTIENTLAYQSMKTSSAGNKGHTGWAQIDGTLTPSWRLGIGGQIHYFFTRVVDAHMKQEGRGDFSEKFKLRFTSFSVWGDISRQF